ncbi:MAG: hypothetical protein ACI30R_05265 [Sodaliphilus sp.]
MFTIICCIVIIVAFLSAWTYIINPKPEDLKVKKSWIEQLPTVISTLGVLGTFIGITKGLLSFDTNDLDKSIPLLLEGLKTAFFTSLLGMLGSMTLNRIVSSAFESIISESEIETAANLIVKTLNSNQKELTRTLVESNKNLVTDLIGNDKEDSEIIDMMGKISDDVEQMKDDIEELKGQLGEVMSHLQSICKFSESSFKEIARFSALATTATASISVIDNNMEELCETLSKIETATSGISDNVEIIIENKQED